jgi:hypothetical protein
VAYFSHAGTVETQKPRNTHSTIEERVFTARYWVKHATMGSLLPAPRPLLCYDWCTHFNNRGRVFCAVGAEVI